MPSFKSLLVTAAISVVAVIVARKLPVVRSYL